MASTGMKLLFMIWVVLILMFGTSGSAESLFDPAGADLFTDLRARNIGDIVFIVVSEQTTSSSEAKTDGSKEVEIKGGLRVEGFFDELFGFPAAIEPIKALDIDPEEEFKASGKTSNRGTFTTRITATVIDILPNGNFVIEGKRSITINEDTEAMILRGTIRPTDISAANTISSQLLADVDIIYTGRGQIADRQKGGLFTELFNFLF
jgi:flagellar L-ring protein precursor FlgH